MPVISFALVNFWHGKNGRHSGFQSDLSKVFKEDDIFTAAGLPYFNPHSFRNTLVQLGQEVCKTPEEYKAWSQNLGHEKVLTTFLNYGEVACQRQGEIIRELAMPQKKHANECRRNSRGGFQNIK